jgi:hypothetical protein
LVFFNIANSKKEDDGQHNDPKQKNTDVDALPNAYPGCSSISEQAESRFGQEDIT